MKTAIQMQFQSAVFQQKTAIRITKITKLRLLPVTKHRLIFPAGTVKSVTIDARRR